MNIVNHTGGRKKRNVCDQRQEAAKNTGCTVKGVCGKTDEVAELQDLLLHVLKGIALCYREGGIRDGDFADGGNRKDGDANPERLILRALFSTIPNGNFDAGRIRDLVREGVAIRERLKREKHVPVKPGSHDSLSWAPKRGGIPRAGGAGAPPEAPDPAGDRKLPEKASSIGVLSAENEGVRSLRELLIYGLKGRAAYAEHAAVLGYEDDGIYRFVVKGLASATDDLPVGEMVSLVLRAGATAVNAMALLDKANTSAYRNLETTPVNLGVGKNPGILVSGHDLGDLEDLLEQTRGAGVDVYTHGEMLPAQYYPGVTHIAEREPGKRKDFSTIVALAKTCPPPTQIESGETVGGFAHEQISRLAVADAVRSGAVKRFVVMAGCAEYRYNKLDLGSIGGIPRVLDAAQCNDSTSLVLAALTLKDALGLKNINDFPVAYDIAWYDQKAVAVLLALLSLGVKGIRLGPTLPPFLSPGVAKVLVEKFGIKGIGTPERDVAEMVGAKTRACGPAEKVEGIP